MDEGTAPDSLIARRLEHLFATVHPPGRGPYSLREVADAINEAAGTRLISVAYLSQLRSGQRTEPSHSRLAAIARFFGVDVRYFSDDETAQDTDEQLEFLAAMRDSGVRAVAIRAAGLSETALEAVQALIENVRRLERLEDVGEPGAPRNRRKPG
jgi:transcriptional regulator with XRE-family HTH domain